MAKEVEYFGKTDLLFLINLIHTEVNKYVKAVSGKQLTTEDFTTALKTKLEGIDLSIYSTTEEMMAAINAAIASVVGIKFKKVDSIEDLPAVGVAGTIYLVPNGGTGSNINDEYFWDTEELRYEKFGTTEIDLTNYLQKTDVEELSTTEVEAAWNSVFTS